ARTAWRRRHAVRVVRAHLGRALAALAAADRTRLGLRDAEIDARAQIGRDVARAEVDVGRTADVIGEAVDDAHRRAGRVERERSAEEALAARVPGARADAVGVAVAERPVSALLLEVRRGRCRAIAVVRRGNRSMAIRVRRTGIGDITRTAAGA